MSVAAPHTRTVQISVNGVRSPVLGAGENAATEAVRMVHGNPGPANDWKFAIPSSARVWPLQRRGMERA